MGISEKDLTLARERLTPPNLALPEQPGIYRFYDKEKNLLYVGKAKSIKKRLGGYFKPSGTLHGRMNEVLVNSYKVDWVACATEKEALILEALWIREHQPRYNLRLLETDAFGGLLVEKTSQGSKLSTWRGKRPKKGLSFGPYPGVRARDSVDSLISVFQVRSCKEKIFLRAQLQNKPCLLGEVGKCVAPCLSKENSLLNEERAKKLIKFLKEGDTSYQESLEQSMKDAAENQEFELAALKRDQKDTLEKIQLRQSANLNNRSSYDILVYKSEKDIAALTLLTIREGEVKSLRSFGAEYDPTLETSTQVLQLLSLVLNDEGKSPYPTKKILSDIEFSYEEVQLLQGIFENDTLIVKKIKTTSEKKAATLAILNADESLGNLELRRPARLISRVKALEDLQNALDLPSLPYRIECIDISHTQGRLPVASIVVMVDGVTKQSEYRRIFLDPSVGGDDYASIREAVYRRFTGSHAGLTAYPDLLLIDGALNQANSAEIIVSQLLEGSDQHIPIVGIAKRLEELWKANDNEPILLSRTDPALILVQRIRDEAHRWAIGGHRRRREIDALKTKIDGLSGIGQKRKKLLLTHFGDEAAIYRATLSELAATPGIGETLANTIYQQIHQKE